MNQINGNILTESVSYISVEPKIMQNSSSLKNTFAFLLYGSTTGTSKKLTEILRAEIQLHKIPYEIMCLDSKEPEDMINYIKDKCQQSNVISIITIPTWQDGHPPDNAKLFCDFIAESSNDFRFGGDYLYSLKFAIYGIGSTSYSKTYNTVAKRLFLNLKKLGCMFIHNLYLRDENSEIGIEDDYTSWSKNIFKKLSEIQNNLPERKKQKGKDSISLDSSLFDSDNENSYTDDIEDLAVESSVSDNPKDMVTPLIRKSLTKQGYKIVGSHSGVKICRWTKSMIRGRGGCYKHSFYGIKSYCCMEATPSLACANKCVFCWRHNTNPVGTDWKWNLDSPDFIVKHLLENHSNMIKQLKGLPGINHDRFLEASTVKHCALSLVGEPIMYPYINQLVHLLHEKNISTFMVTNAQFPESLKNLYPVTQLYLSIDASTKDSLKAIDRPLFRDFWERFIESIDFLRLKKQRTVFRLTLVKQWNDKEIKDYCDLINRGCPSFVEVKGVTYCGQGIDNEIKIKNSPYHHEVVTFCIELLNFLTDYGIACEHEHSNCVLLAHKKFFINNEWNTWIDYEKFHKLYQKWKESDKNSEFTDLDYCTPTPSWAVFGSTEHGFNPSDTRFRRKKN